MYDIDPSDYEFRTCGKCGATNDPSFSHCRKCGSDLAKSGDFTIPMGLAVGSLGILFLLILMGVTSVLFEEASIFFALLLMLISLILGIVGTIWFYVEAFKENIFWGFACLFLPFASLIFFLLHPGRVIKPIALSIASIVIIFSTILLMPNPLPV